jgi:hypothetical protein
VCVFFHNIFTYIRFRQISSQIVHLGFFCQKSSSAKRQTSQKKMMKCILQCGAPVR